MPPVPLKPIPILDAARAPLVARTGLDEMAERHAAEGL